MGILAVRHDPVSAALVRRSITADLAARSIPPDGIADVVLVASELVNNAVLHTDGDGLGVSWEASRDAVTVRVTDPSHELPQLRPVSERDIGGRGLAIVAAVAAEWGVRRSAKGKEVWARVRFR